MGILQVFNFDGVDVRTKMIEGEPWFVGKDIATILGYKNVRDALAKHVDPDDKGGSQIATPSGIQTMTVINESGLYSLILSSKQPNAKKFKRWVTAEVLPTIRKRGMYMTEATLEKAVKTGRVETLSAKRLEIMANNSKIKLTQQLLQAAKLISSQHSKDLVAAEVARILTDGRLPLTVKSEKLLTASDLEEMTGVSKNTIGKLAKQHGIQPEAGTENEFGEFQTTTVRNSHREVQIFAYNSKGVKELKRLAKEWKKAHQ